MDADEPRTPRRRDPDFERAVDLFEGIEDPEPRPREEPEPRPTRKRRAGGALAGETLRRILFAIPWIAFAIAIVVAGGITFALAMVVIGLICLRELFLMTADSRPLAPAGYVAAVGLIAAAYFGTSFNVLLALSCSFALIFLFALRRHDREGITGSVAITLLGVVWIGIPLVHAVLLRELPDHGAALLVNVLVGTFASDTGAYAVGRMFGSHPIAPRLSPNKTVEGLVGGFVIGTMAFWFAGLYQDWLSGIDALAMGAVVALVAPLGDLFESMLKRDLDTKDTGRLFGPHGGFLDRLDAVLFTIVAGYYLSVHFIY